MSPTSCPGARLEFTRRTRRTARPLVRLTGRGSELAALLGRPIDGPVAFALDFDLTNPRGADWRRLVQTPAAGLTDEDSLLRRPVVAASMIHSVLAGLLLAARHDYREELDAPPSYTGPATSFTSNVVAGVLVLLLTVFVVDRVIRIRQLTNESRAVGAPVALIVAQASRAVDTITRAARSAEGRAEAAGEVRTYTQTLLSSRAPC